jgi:hypothetical protein
MNTMIQKIINNDVPRIFFGELGLLHLEPI